MTKRKALRLLLLAATLAVCALIFFFSSQGQEDTEETSGAVTELLLRIAVPGYDGLPADQQTAYLDSWGAVVRKLAHFSEFALLALLLLCDFALARRDGRWAPALLPAWGTATLYAATDEAHQLLVSGRGAAFTDVLIDSAGALCGALLMLVVHRGVRALARK